MEMRIPISEQLITDSIHSGSHPGGTLLDRMSRHYLPTLSYERCIAGGYAACPERASDVDVWVYGVPDERLERVREDILSHLWISSIVFEEENSRAETLGNSAYANQHTLKVAKVLPIHGLPVHIMVTSLPSPSAIINGFDISTHMVAIDQLGRVVRNDYWTPLNAEPVIIRDTSTTGERMQKIRARYADMRS